MRKTFGWSLIIMFILSLVLPLYHDTMKVLVEYPPKVTDVITFKNDEMIINKVEIPDVRVEEKTFRTWLILIILTDLIENPAYGIGRIIGHFGVLGIGIWLARKSKKSAKSIEK